MSALFDEDLQIDNVGKMNTYTGLVSAFARHWVAFVACIFLVFGLGSSFAQDVDSYEVHSEGQFAGMTGQDILDASDRAAADGEAARKAGDWGGAYGSYYWARRLRRMVYQDTHAAQFEMEHALASAAMQSAFFYNAKRHFESAYENRAGLLGPNHPDTLSSLSGYIAALLQLGQYDRAHTILPSALERASTELGDKHPITLDLRQHHGRALLQQDRVRDALDVFAHIVEDRQAGGSAQSSGIATGLSDLAAAQLALGDLSNASSNARRANQMLADLESKKPTDLAYARATLGDVMFASGKVYDAGHEYHVAREHLTDVGSEMLLARSINAKIGRVFLRLPDYADLAKPYLEAALVETSRNYGSASTDLNRQVHRMLVDAYSIEQRTLNGSSALDDGGSGDEPLLYPEIFRSMIQSFDRRTDQAIVAAIGRSTPGERGELVRKRERLLIEREELQAEYAAAQGAGGAEARELRIALRHNASAISEADRRIADVFPEYLDFIGSRAIELETPSELLRPNEALLMIVPTELSTQVLLYREDGHEWNRTTASPGEIARAVRRLLWDVGAPNDASPNEVDDWLIETENQGAYPYSFSDAKFLYDQIFASADLEGVDHVFVVADGPLGSLPLGMLVTEMPEGSSGDPETLRSAEWFANTTSFSVLPSLQTLYFLRKHRSAENTSLSRFIGVGDPVLEGKAVTRGRVDGAKRNITAAPSYEAVFAGERSGAATTSIDVAALRSLTRLPGTASELTNIWTTLGRPEDSLLLAESATETNVKARAIQADVVVFATHGLLACEVQGVAEPGLVLTPPSEPDDIDDGYLGTSDIVTLDLDANWVILSACNTAASDGNSGSSGLSGLARAFFFAGARNLLVSHWPVRDDVAAQLTVRTVELTQGEEPMTRAQALRQAMAEIRQNPNHDSDVDTWAHPNAWAPFSFVGDGSLMTEAAAR